MNFIKRFFKTDADKIAIEINKQLKGIVRPGSTIVFWYKEKPGFFKNAMRDISIGILVAMFFLLIASVTVAAAQKTKPETVIDLGEQHIFAIDTTVISDSVKIVESKIRITDLLENFAIISNAREKYAERLAEINRAIMRRK